MLTRIILSDLGGHCKRSSNVLLMESEAQKRRLHKTMSRCHSLFHPSRNSLSQLLKIKFTPLSQLGRQTFVDHGGSAPSLKTALRAWFKRRWRGSLKVVETVLRFPLRCLSI